jgi:shikimate 5-dehydrogenase
MNSESSSKTASAPLRRFYFLGVTTGKSSVQSIFPRWSRELGLNAEIVGIDLPLDASAERYREVLERLRRDEHAAGGLVTSHKIGVIRAGRDLFSRLDPFAERLQEVACIVRRPDGALEGSAKDPITSMQALRRIVPASYWRETGAEILCLGVGGSGQAFAMGALSEWDSETLPRRIVLVARNQKRIDEARRALEGLPNVDRIECRLAPQPTDADRLLDELPPGSLVANATGLGKDAPGSPLTDAARFPEKGIAWDFNYRGDLLFLEQARRQEEPRKLRVEDGWVYFLYGWTQVMAEVFGFRLDDATFRRMEEIADFRRP